MRDDDAILAAIGRAEGSAREAMAEAIAAQARPETLHIFAEILLLFERVATSLGEPRGVDEDEIYQLALDAAREVTGPLEEKLDLIFEDSGDSVRSAVMEFFGRLRLEAQQEYRKEES